MKRYYSFRKFSQDAWDLTEDPNTPSEVLKELPKDKNEEIIREASQNLSVPIDVMIEFSTGPRGLRDDLTELIADRLKQMSSGELEEIYNRYKDTKYRDKVNRCIADAPNLPEYIIRELAKDDHCVRGYVAQNPNCPEDILRQLANDEFGNVVYWVVRNPNTPPDVLRQLASEDSEDVSDVARKRLKELRKQIPQKQPIPKDYRKMSIDELENLMNRCGKCCFEVGVLEKPEGSYMWRPGRRGGPSTFCSYDEAEELFYRKLDSLKEEGYSCKPVPVVNPDAGHSSEKRYFCSGFHGVDYTVYLRLDKDCIKECAEDIGENIIVEE